jgi:DNA polymerase eta
MEAHARRKTKRERPDSESRCILLFDLDCFYAQSICRRLGYDAQTTPLALFQWNSVLAVTYPARKLYQVQRGDSWEAVHQKSQGQCLGVHVPILTTSRAAPDHVPEEESSCQCREDEEENAKLSITTDVTLQDEYRDFYCLTPEQQEAARRQELGVRKFSTQGKACIECFRIASATILHVVQTAIEQLDSRIIIERASIDEFFVDVTYFCQQKDPVFPSDCLSLTQCMEKTVIISSEARDENHSPLWNDDDHDDNEELSPEMRSMQYGCAIAHYVRQAVFDTLGFTMSAGIGPNKTLAKLAASYGKPAGQAVIYPHSVAAMLEATPIRKCRHLGGKVGKMVEQLLPEDVPKTMGSIAQYLSLPMLRQGLKNSDLAQKVFDLARGIDIEPVESKTPNASAILTKSITAFKSLNFAPNDAGSSDGSRNTAGSGHTIAEASQWIELLVKEIVSRVERDTQRNARYPRNCVVQYHAPSSKQEYSHQNNKSIRLPFPSFQLPKEERIRILFAAVPIALQNKFNSNASTVRLHRVGLCATDFETISGGKAISSYFTTSVSTGALPTRDGKSSPQSRRGNVKNAEEVVDSKVDPISIAQASQQVATVAPVDEFAEATSLELERSSKTHVVDRDLELARKLQATYDREERSLQVMEMQRSYIGAIKNRFSNGGVSKTKQVADRKINSFFSKK